MQLMKAIIVLVTLFFLFMRCDTKMQTEYLTDIEGETVKVTNDNFIKTKPDWSPDGNTILFCGERNVNPIVSMQPQRGADQQVVIVLDADISSRPAISPDGKFLAYTANDKTNLRVVCLEDGTETILAHNHPGVKYPAWSHDGKHIAYSALDNMVWNIWMTPATGGIEKQITNEQRDCTTPCWSPNDEYIAYQFKSSSYFNVWYTSLSDGSRKRMTSYDSDDEFPDWSPDGTNIIYHSFRNGRSSIWQVNIDDRTEKEITSSINDATRPVYSHDGKLIFFETSIKVGVCNSDGSGFKKLSGFGNIFPQWDAKANRIIMTQLLVPFSTVCTVSLSNFKIEPIALGENDILKSNARWFSTRTIAFLKNNNIHFINKNRGKIEKLCSDSDINRLNFRISPDGNYIAYDNGTDIFVESISKGRIANMTKHIDLALTQPTWSPDNTQIACRSSSGMGIYRIDEDKLIETNFFPGRYDNPHWSKEGVEGNSHIAFERYNDIYLFSSMTYEEKLVIREGVEPCWSANGTEIAFIRNNNIFYKKVLISLD